MNLINGGSYPPKYFALTVRGWFGGHLYPEKPTDGKMDIFKYEAKGVTDLFLNEPEKYCG